MTQFEYLTIGISILIGLSVARLLDGLRDALDPDRRYWIHIVWVMNKLLHVIGLFWYAWVSRDAGGARSLGEYLVIVSPVALVYLQINALLTTRPDAIRDWRSHFFEIRRWFFGIGLLFAPIGIYSVSVIEEFSLLSPGNAALAVGFVYNLVGMLSASERVHGVIATLAAASLTLGLLGLSFGLLVS